MRWACLAVVVVAAGCAKQHGGQAWSPSPVDEGAHDGPRHTPTAAPERDAGPVMVPADAAWPLLDGGWHPLFPTLLDGGFPGFDASDIPLFDAGAPDGAQPASQLVDPRGRCEQPSPPPDTSGTCRDERWHEPACYRVPSECEALWETTYCISVLDDRVHYLGMDSGRSCALRFTSIPHSGDFGSMAQIGADLLLCNNGIVERVALSDGSFDTAPLACSALFEVNNQLVVHEPISGSLTRYPSWQATTRGEGEVLAFASPGALFAANDHMMVALWPGSNELAILAIDGSVSNRINLVGFGGQVTGLELSNDDELFVATPEGISTYDASSGEATAYVSFGGAHGLVCHAGLHGNPPGRNQAAAPRPGAERGGRDYIVEVTGCTTPLEGPRYMAQNGGPELLVLATSQVNDNVVVDERSTPHTLVLSSRDQSTWRVVIEPGARVERLLVTGQQRVTMERPSGVTVPISFLADGATLPIHDGRVPGHGETMLRSAIESNLERPISELAGCMTSALFTIRDEPLPLCVH